DLHRLGTLRGWARADVYVLILTLLIIPLHAGFHFGCDVHTLAYLLLVIVILSGMVGLFLYLTVPTILTTYESNMLPDKLEAEIHEILKDMNQPATHKPRLFPRLHQEE